MKGMHAETGRPIAGLDHLYQSVNKILTTPTGTRVARRDFGTELVNLIDAPNNGMTQARLYAAVATSLMRWEPRIALTRVQLVPTPIAARAGTQAIDIEAVLTLSNDLISIRVPLPDSIGHPFTTQR